jgi:hypothetical protein
MAEQASVLRGDAGSDAGGGEEGGRGGERKESA